MLHNTIDEEYPDARRRGRADDHDADAEELAAHAYCCGVLHAAAAPGWANLTAETLTRQVKGLLGKRPKSEVELWPAPPEGGQKKTPHPRDRSRTASSTPLPLNRRAWL